MATIRPFCALMPAPGLAPKVACPPYDVINTAEARALFATGACSLLQVTRPEVALAPTVDEHADEVHQAGRAALARLLEAGTLVKTGEASVWLYAQQMGAHRQVGLVACASVADYDADAIKKHEKTRPDKEDDRTRHIDVLSAHDEPVFLTYRSVASIDEVVRQATARPPLEDFTLDDGVRHTVWATTPEERDALVSLFASQVPALYVADGHHRSAAASRVNKLRAGQQGEHDAFLAVVFPHDQMQILPYNRLVRDSRKRGPEAILRAFAERFDMTGASTPAPPSPRVFGVYIGGAWYHAAVRPGTFDTANPVASLDCSLFQDQVLSSIFGIDDPRTDKRVDFVGGIRGTRELERRVKAEGFDVAACLYPTQIEQLLAVSDAGLLMPPKSTWFEPKLRSGLFLHGF